MKTLSIIKSTFTVITLLVCSIAVQASSPKNYMYDTKEENGKVVSKVVYVEDKGLLDKQVMYEFSYNDDGKVAEKKAFRWSKSANKWEPFFLITYSYGNEGDEINSVYGMWDKKKKDYSLNVQTLNLPASSYEDIFS